MKTKTLIHLGGGSSDCVTAIINAFPLSNRIGDLRKGVM